MKRALLDYCASITDGDHLPPPKSKNGVPFITISNFTSFNKISFKDTMFVPLEYYNNLPDSKKPRQGDILYSVVGSFGIPIYIEDNRPFVFQRHIAIFRPKQDVCGKYLYYLLLNPQFYKLMDKLAIGCAQRTITLDTLRNLPLEFPNLHSQEKIAGVLSAIDKKINNNIRICSELESMAKMLYDYWFVQFDFPDENGKPYRTSGGEMVWNDQLKREIPKGWCSGKLSDIANITMGQSPDGESYNENGDGTVFYQGRTDFGMRFPTPRMYTTAPTRFASKGDVLLSVRAPVGDLNFAMEDCCIGRGLAALNSKLGSQMHLFYTLTGFQQIFGIMDGNGTTFGSITKDTLFDMGVVIPESNILNKFEKQVLPIEKKIEACEIENRELTKLRDWLLPMLMNGQATVE